MNFSIGGGGIGLIGGFVLFGALMLVFTIVVTLVTRAVRGPDDEPAAGGEPAADRRAPEDDYIL